MKKIDIIRCRSTETIICYYGIGRWQGSFLLGSETKGDFLGVTWYRPRLLFSFNVFWRYPWASEAYLFEF